MAGDTPPETVTERGADDERTGRLPVLIAANYQDGDVQRHDSAIRDVGWKTEGRVLLGRALRVEG